MIKKFSIILFSLSLVFSLSFSPAFADEVEKHQDEAHETHATDAHEVHAADDIHAHGDDAHHDAEEEEFNAGKMIIDHIVDAHDWHLWDYKGHAVSIPLPVILFDDGKLVTFMSSKLEHGHAVYKGYRLETSGDNKGKIVKLDDHGDVASIPLDFSITKTVVAIFIMVLLLIWIFISIAKTYKKREGMAPKGMQSLFEPIILFIRDDIAVPSIGKKKAYRYMPFLLTIFFFIFLSNLFGLVPLGINITGNIAVTLVLALFTFIITTFSGNKYYWKHILWPDVPHGLKILMIPIEIIGMFIKPFVLMVRLFANMTAGHIIILGFMSLIFIFSNFGPVAGGGTTILSVGFVLFMSVLELLVALIQAYVFTLLSALYFGMAVEEHH